MPAQWERTPRASAGSSGSSQVVTGTPQMQQASDWAMERFRTWGLSNVHQERFAFGQGWRVAGAGIDRALHVARGDADDSAMLPFSG